MSNALASTPPAAQSGAPPALSTRGVVKRFGGLAAVDGISISVPKGRIFGLIGPNGAGKTTLFDLLAGEQRPSAGAILINGTEVQNTPPHARVARGLARTFQIPRPFPGMTVIENVMLGAQGQCGERIWPNWLTPARVRGEERAARDKARELLQFLQLEGHALQPARVLSGGQRKLLELARALMTEPSLLLLDEPAAGVNPTLLRLIVDRVAEINRRGVAVLVIEHNMDVIVKLCEHVFVMAAGKLLCEGTPDSVTKDHRVIEAYLGGLAA